MSTTETLKFEAEVQELLGLMIHSLYRHKEIFLRELISNASDALDKLRFEALTRPELLEGGEELEIRLEVDRDARELAVVDDGIGMSHDELVQNLGTVASSGTRRFLQKVHEKGGESLPELIGQFGVGFYSAFMVADVVTVSTRRAGEDEGWIWRSTGDGEYTLEAAQGLPRGTRVALHMREPEEGDPDFLSTWALKEIVRRYSDFVEHPIRAEVEHYERPKDAEGKELEGAEPEKVVRTETLNSMKPLWSRDKADITEEEYREFYKHLTRDWQDPLEVVHFKAEGTTEYTALLFVPSTRPFDLFDGSRRESRLSLYAKRVFIMADCEELLPPWLRFVRGLVDSPDLPLNVSRETLQSNRTVRQIRKRLTRKVLETLAELLEENRDQYAVFWENFGAVLKEGIYAGEDEDERIAKICLFRSTASDAWTTLDEYVERMAEGQKAIYTYVAPDGKHLERSPHLEACRERGIEVLLLTDPVDEWMLTRWHEYHEKPLRAVEKGVFELESEAERSGLEEKKTVYQGVLEAMWKVLSDRVREVRFSSRLTSSPAVLVSDESAPSPSMERVLRQLGGQTAPAQKRVLELNPKHPIVERLKHFHDEDTDDTRVEKYTELLYGQALLAEGSPLEDPGRFAELVTELMVAGDEG